ncbi:HEAT repeat domain-containing protein [Nocardia sp. NPDC003482]
MTEPSSIAAELLNDYRSAGGHGRTLSDISGHRRQPKKAIPVLAQWLRELETRWEGGDPAERELARELLIRGLNVPESRNSPAIPALLSQFDRVKAIDELVRWAAGNSLYEIPADDSYFDELVAIALDRSWGMSRQMVVNWLGRSQRKDEAAEAALSLLDDETVQGHALEALARLRTQGIRDVIEPFTKSKNRWHRRTATRILNHLVED